MVIIIPDNDRTDEEHAEDVARRLRRIAAEVRVVRLPDLPKKRDVLDWLDAGGQAATLDEMCLKAPLWKETRQFAPIRNQNRLFDTSFYRAHVIDSDLDAVEKLLLIILLDAGERNSPS